jgi:PKD repeat protein
MRIGVVQNAMREYLPALPQSSRICFIAFNNGIVSEQELTLSDAATLQKALAWVDDLDRLSRSHGGTHLWTTLRHGLEVASRYSHENPNQPVVVRVLTDGEDNERVTTLDKVLSQFPLVDGEHIRGNLVILGDFELKTKAALAEAAFTITKSVTWSDIFPPVVLWFPTEPQTGNEVRFVENTRSIYGDYEWLIDGQTLGKEKLLLHRFAAERLHRVTLKVKGIQGNSDSTTVFVNVRPKENFTVAIVSTSQATISPGESIRFWVRPSAPAVRFAWYVNEQTAGSAEEFARRFDSEGTFEVKALVWSADGVRATNTRTLTVKESPITVNIKAPSQAIAGQPIQFAADIAGPCDKLQWRFGDGSTASERDPVHTFGLQGQVSQDVQVWLRVESPLGHAVEAGPHNLRVQAREQMKPPVAAFRMIEQSARAGDPLHLVDESRGYIETWEWRVGGVRVANDKNPAIELAKPGLALVTLVVRGPGGTNEASKQVLVSQRYSPVRVRVAGSRLSGNAPLSVQFTNLSTGDVRAWRWEFGDGQSSTNANPQHTFAGATNYNVALTAYPSDESQTPSRAQLTIKAAKPRPTWAKAALSAGALGGLAGLAAWLARQRRREKLRLAVFWWPEQAAVCRRADLNAPEEARDLKPEVPLRIRRVGKTEDLLVVALDGAAIVTADGQETTSQNIGPGARLLVKTASGAEKAIAIAVNQKPRRPSPAASGVVIKSPEVESSATQASRSGDFDWGWDSASTSKTS